MLLSAVIQPGRSSIGCRVVTLSMREGPSDYWLLQGVRSFGELLRMMRRPSFWSGRALKKSFLPNKAKLVRSEMRVLVHEAEQVAQIRWAVFRWVCSANLGIVPARSAIKIPLMMPLNRRNKPTSIGVRRSCQSLGRPGATAYLPNICHTV